MRTRGRREWQLLRALWLCILLELVGGCASTRGGAPGTPGYVPEVTGESAVDYFDELVRVLVSIPIELLPNISIGAIICRDLGAAAGSSSFGVSAAEIGGLQRSKDRPQLGEACTWLWYGPPPAYVVEVP